MPRTSSSSEPSAARESAARSAMNSPAAVGRTLWASRSKSGTLTARSSDAICCETAEPV